jgi:hypothetical protein
LPKNKQPKLNPSLGCLFFQAGMDSGLGLVQVTLKAANHLANLVGSVKNVNDVTGRAVFQLKKRCQLGLLQFFDANAACKNLDLI